MGVLTASRSGPLLNYDIFDLFNLISGSLSGPATSTSFARAFGTELWSITGSGFGSYSAGFPTTGTITSITFSIGSETVCTLTGVSISVPTLWPLLQAGNIEGAYQLAFAGVDTINGSDQDDILYGFGGADNITGGAGNDTLSGDGPSGAGGDDIIDGGAGNDTISGGAGVNTLTGGEGNDTISSGLGSNTLTGGAGDDVITSRGVDSINGGDGFDVLNIGGRPNSMLGFTYDISTWGSGAQVTLSDGTTFQNFESYVFSSGSRADTIIFSGTPTFNFAFFGNGNDELVLDLSSLATTISMTFHHVNAAGREIRFFGVNVEITGGSTWDMLLGDGGDLVSGGGGDDQLTGHNGGNTLNGGDGNDSIESWALGDVIDGGAGIDAVGGLNLASTSLNGISVSTAAMATQTGVTFGGTTIRNVEALKGFVMTQGDDTLTITASDLSEVLSGPLIGAGGFDTLILDLSTATENYKLLNSGLGTPPEFGPTTDFERHIYTTGSGNDTLQGHIGDDILSGGAGDDFLEGGPGGDTLDGDAGLDIVVYDSLDLQAQSAITVDLANPGVNAGAAAGDSYISIEGVTGTNFNDVLRGNELSNVLRDILMGDDTLEGRSGDDILDGGYLGNDVLDGGLGHDQLIGQNGSDLLIGGFGNDTIDGGGDNDTIMYAIGDGADAIDGGSGVDTLNVAGDASENVLNVSYNGLLSGIFGGSITDVDIINADMGAGTDWLVYTATSGAMVNLTTGAASGFTSLLGVENVIGGSSSDTFTGNNIANRLDGGLGDDVLNGAGGADILIGGDGLDVLSGGLAGDNLNGGAGNDTLAWAWGEGADTLNGGADADTLNATGTGVDNIVRATWNGSTITNLFDNVLLNLESVNVDMSSGVDWLVYTASAAVTVDLNAGAASGFASLLNVENVVGGSGADTLTGNALANRLDGGLGDDILAGGAGSDALLGGDGNDTLTGGVGNDSTQGGAGNDSFDWLWGDGRDTFNGGADSDTLGATGSAVENIARATWNGSVITGLFDNALVSIETIHLDMSGGADWLIYNAASGVSVDLSAGAASGFASITSIENVIGGTGDDALAGDGASNKLHGGDGADAITGGAGGDILTGGLGADVFVYAAGAGTDSITDFDAAAAGGQDLIDLTGFGVTGGDFGARVVIADLGGLTRVTIDGDVVINLSGVNGDGANVITVDDFILS